MATKLENQKKNQFAIQISSDKTTNTGLDKKVLEDQKVKMTKDFELKLIEKEHDFKIKYEK